MPSPVMAVGITVLLASTVAIPAILSDAPAASASTVCFHSSGLPRICRTPVPGGTRVCLTSYLGEGSTETCHIERTPAPRPAPAHHSAPALPRSYYLTKGEAEGDARSNLVGLGYEEVRTNCILNSGHAKAGYAYHLWICAMEGQAPGVEGVCEAEGFVAGTNRRHYYRYEKVHSNEYCELGY